MCSTYFNSYKNFISIANANRNDVGIYFYIKNFAFRKMINIVNFDKNAFTSHESSMIGSDLQKFKEETANLPIPSIDKEAFMEFLENFYSQFKFEIPDVKTFQLCKGITEMLTIYGPLDDLASQRSI